jgi:hypothetical protein
LSEFDRDESGWRRGINNATCTGSRWVGAINRSGSDPAVHGQWVDADLLGELSLVEPGVPELTNELIDLGLIATPARALDVMHPSPSPGSKQFGNHGVHRTLTLNKHRLFGIKRQEFNDTGGKLYFSKCIYIKPRGKRNSNLVLIKFKKHDLYRR